MVYPCRSAWVSNCEPHNPDCPEGSCDQRMALCPLSGSCFSEWLSVSLLCWLCFGPAVGTSGTTAVGPQSKGCYPAPGRGPLPPVLVPFFQSPLPHQFLVLVRPSVLTPDEAPAHGCGKRHWEMQVEDTEGGGGPRGAQAPGCRHPPAVEEQEPCPGNWRQRDHAEDCPVPGQGW